MNQVKTYEFAGYTFKTYYKAVGMGYEIGLTSSGKTYFIGNFVHDKDAKKYWAFFNKQVVSFYKKFEYSDESPRDFYGKFMANFLYSEYYKFLFDIFEGYNKFYGKAFDKDYQKYEKMFQA